METRRSWARGLSAMAGCLAIFTGLGAAAQGGPPFGANLVVNGGAEDGPGVTSASATIAPPGWTTTGALTSARYGGPGPPNPTDPGPPDRGDNYFAGGPDSAKSTAEQTIDVSAAATAIDAGTLKYRLGGYLGGFGNQDDNVVVFARFVDAAGHPIGQASIGPVTPAQRGNQTGLLARTTSGVLPARTRAVVIRPALPDARRRPRPDSRDPGLRRLVRRSWRRTSPNRPPAG